MDTAAGFKGSVASGASGASPNSDSSVMSISLPDCAGRPLGVRTRGRRRHPPVQYGLRPIFR
jgi:hypothetical protein